MPSRRSGHRQLALRVCDPGEAGGCQHKGKGGRAAEHIDGCVDRRDVVENPGSEPDVAKSLLVVAMARARNTGMKVFQGSRLLARGEAPVRMEPVMAAISIRKSGKPTVYLLDHDGCRTVKTLPISSSAAGESAFEIDGARDRTCYYLIAYSE